MNTQNAKEFGNILGEVFLAKMGTDCPLTKDKLQAIYDKLDKLYYNLKDE